MIPGTIAGDHFYVMVNMQIPAALPVTPFRQQ
jgi:hypothetical protein